ncbi:MAG TPA: TatD family hydrolase [Candidatus Thermoplasmatota archaeon]|nr:TatD family hydrolase [Candidatus Thermoplasmatota archaeon]
MKRPEVPVHDNHFHCRPDGWKGLGAVREFMAAGGTSIAHVRLPSYPATVEAFRASSADHVAFSERIRKETGCLVRSAVGPYPLEIMKVAEAKGWPAAEGFGRACYDAAAGFCEERTAACIGEVGRAHFEVPAETQERLNGLLLYGMGKAKDAGVPIMLHTEHAEPATMAEFAAMADRAGLARDRVIKHYCGPLVLDAETHGIVPSIICGRSNLRDALKKAEGSPCRFLLETDYIDDPERQNVVMPCDTVPKRVHGLLANGEMTERQAVEIGEEMVRRLYGP